MEGEEDDHISDNQLVYVNESWKKQIPIGFRFSPTIDELFLYLIKRVSLDPIPHGIFHEFDVYQSQPSDLPEGLEKLDDGENKYAYFFTHRHKINVSNPNAKNQKRSTRDNKGSWKSTSKPASFAVGIKNILVYHLKTRGTKPVLQKTNWIMHEFVLRDYSIVKNPQDKNVVLCRIYERNDESGKQENQQNVVNGIKIDEVEAKAGEISCILKRKECPVDQLPYMSRELSTINDLHQYLPIHYSEQEQIGVPLSYPIRSCPYAHYQAPMSTYISNPFSCESVKEEYSYPLMSGSSSAWSLISIDEPQPLHDSVTDNSPPTQQRGTRYTEGCTQKLRFVVSRATSLPTTLPTLKTVP